VEFRLHLFVGEGFLALLHAADVFKVLLLYPAELLYDHWVSQIYVVLRSHIFQFLRWLREVQIHDVIEMLLSEQSFFELLLDNFGLFAAICLPEQSIRFLRFIYHLLQIFHLSVVFPLLFGKYLKRKLLKFCLHLLLNTCFHLLPFSFILEVLCGLIYLGDRLYFALFDYALF
jgi:hypothetical protein